MNDWFSVIGKISELSAQAVQDLNEIGFTVISSAIKSNNLPLVTAAYDDAVCFASSDDKRIGSSTTRVNDFANRGSEFDELYIFPPLVEACYQIIGQSFKLSSIHARTLHPNVQAQELHIDFKKDEEKFPLVGFILMIDEFQDRKSVV